MIKIMQIIFLIDTFLECTLKKHIFKYTKNKKINLKIWQYFGYYISGNNKKIVQLELYFSLTDDLNLNYAHYFYWHRWLGQFFLPEEELILQDLNLLKFSKVVTCINIFTLHTNDNSTAIYNYSLFCTVFDWSIRNFNQKKHHSPPDVHRANAKCS